MQRKPVNHIRLAGARRDLDTSTRCKYLTPSAPVGISHINFAPRLRGKAVELLPKRLANNRMRTFPNHYGACIRTNFDERYAKKKCMMLADMASSLWSLCENAVDMGCIAVHSVTIRGFAFPIHRLWVTRIADRNLCCVPGVSWKSELSVHELDRSASEIWPADHRALRVVCK